MNREIRKLTDGAMMAATIGVLLLINRQTAGLIEVSFIWLLPLPMVFYGAKYGWRDSWVLYIAIMLLTFVLGTPQTLFYMASEMLIGVIYGCGIYKRVSTRKLVIRTMILAVVADILSMLVFASFFGYDLTSEANEYVTMLSKVFAQSGTRLPESMDLGSMVKNIIVLSVILSGVLEGYVTHILSRLMLKRLRIYSEPMTPITEYYPPVWSGYVGIVGMVLFYYASYHAFDNEIVMNCMQGFGIAGVIYLWVFGVIAAMIFMRLRFQMKGLSLFVVVLFCLFLVMPMAVLGFLYITTDFHSRLMQGGTDHAYKNS